jgi:hypothetical protein
MKQICSYCESLAELVSGDIIYPHRADLAKLKFWLCAPCGAYVGCHKAGSYRFEEGKKIFHIGTEAMGRLANADLRRAKVAAHAAFDPFWKNQGWNRKAAYVWLSKKIGTPIDRTHIGEFDMQMCASVVALVLTMIGSKYLKRQG